MVTLDEVQKTIMGMWEELAGGVRKRHAVLLEFCAQLWYLEDTVNQTLAQGQRRTGSRGGQVSVGTIVLLNMRTTM